MSGKRIVTAVVSRNSHDGTRAVSCQHIIAYPDGNFGARYRIDRIRTAENSGYTPVGNAFTLGAFFCSSNIICDFLTLLRRGAYLHQITFRCQHHEGYAVDGVCSCCENIKCIIFVF